MYQTARFWDSAKVCNERGSVSLCSGKRKTYFGRPEIRFVFLNAVFWRSKFLFRHWGENIESLGFLSPLKAVISSSLISLLYQRGIYLAGKQLPDVNKGKRRERQSGTRTWRSFQQRHALNKSPVEHEKLVDGEKHLFSKLCADEEDMVLEVVHTCQCHQNICCAAKEM
jgi:hypothetical protein